MLTPEQKEELMTYLKKRFKYIRECVALIETFFKNEYDRYALQTGIQGKPSPEIQHALHDIEYGLAVTFRYCMLVAVCSFVEEFLKNLSSRIVPDYHQKIKKYQGGEFKKLIKLLKSDAGMDFAPIKNKINFFEDIITVRNAVVHAWGKVGNSKRLETIIKKYNGIQKTDDGYVFLEDQAVKKMLIATIEIVRHICSII